mgnify:CR=1 FL=1
MCMAQRVSKRARSAPTRLVAAEEEACGAWSYYAANKTCLLKTERAEVHRREAMEALEAARGRVIGGLVVCVQAEARGWLTRRHFARMKTSALIIQRCARGFAARTWLRRYRAAIKLQAAVRSWLCKGLFQQQKAAAIAVQCSWRVASEQPPDLRA